MNVLHPSIGPSLHWARHRRAVDAWACVAIAACCGIACNAASAAASAAAAPGDAVVLAVAGSSDARAVDDCRDMGERLSAALGAPVIVGFLSAAEPRLADAVAAVRASGDGRRVVAASYLLAPGYFQDLAAAAGADLITEPLLTPGDAPNELVELVLERYAHAVAEASGTAPGA
jgi:sirohydrochlorin ferrochelatase